MSVIRKEGRKVTQPSTAEKKVAQPKVEKFPNGFGSPRINVEGKDRFPINRDSEFICPAAFKFPSHCILLIQIQEF